MRESVLSLVRAHWGLGSRVLADIWFPDAPAETTDSFARVQRGAATAEMAADLLEMFYRFDVDEILPTVRVPTLVLHRRGSRAVRFELGRELAALIPGAQLSALDGRMQPIYAEGADERPPRSLPSCAISRRRTASAAHRAGTPGRRPDRRRVRPTPRSPGSWACRCGPSTPTSSTSARKLGVRARTQIAVWGSQQSR